MREVTTAAGATLSLPEASIEDMVEREVQARMMMRADAPIAVTPFSGGAHAFGRGVPNKQSLMRELVLADSATAIRVISERVMSIGLHAFRKTQDDEREPDPDTMLEDILQTPNPLFFLEQLLSITVWTLVPVGEAFWQVIPDAFGKPVELWPIPWDRVEPIATRDMPVSHYEVRDANGGTVRLETEEVIHFWFPDPANPTRGIGRLAPQAARWNAARSQDLRFDRFYKNDATPRTALQPISMESELPEGGNKKTFEAMWRNQQHRIHGVAQGIPVIAPAGFNFHEFSEPGFEGELGLRKQLSDDLYKSYGVPEALLGVVSDVNRASTEGVRFIFDLNTILPLMTLIVKTLNRQLVPLFDETAELEVQHDDFVAEDKDFRLKQEDQDLKNKVRVVNEVRATRPDLESVDYGNQPVGTIAEVPYTGEDPFSFESESADDLGPREDGPAVGASPPSRSSSGSRDRMRTHFSPRAQWQRNVATERKFTSTTRKLVNRVLAIQNRDVAKNLIAAAERVLAQQTIEDEAEHRAHGRLRSQESKWSRALVDVDMAQLFDPNDPRWAAEWTRQLGPQWREIFVDAGVEVWEGLGLANPFELTPTMVNQIAGNIQRLVTQTGSHSWTQIDGILRKGIAEGASPSSVAARIKSSVFSTKRAKAIARTEIGKANQQGQLLGMESSQVVREKEWNTSQDAAVRDSHRIDGQTVNINSQFTLNSGAKAQHPLDPNLPVGDVVNCRCFMTPVIGVEDL